MIYLHSHWTAEQQLQLPQPKTWSQIQILCFFQLSCHKSPTNDDNNNNYFSTFNQLGFFTFNFSTILNSLFFSKSTLGNKQFKPPKQNKTKKKTHLSFHQLYTGSVKNQTWKGIIVEYLDHFNISSAFEQTSELSTVHSERKITHEEFEVRCEARRVFIAQEVLFLVKLRRNGNVSGKPRRKGPKPWKRSGNGNGLALKPESRGRDGEERDQSGFWIVERKGFGCERLES